MTEPWGLTTVKNLNQPEAHPLGKAFGNRTGIDRRVRTYGLVALSANIHHSHFAGTTNMGIFDWKHWVVILIVVTLVFGTKKLKNLGSDLGETIKGFRKAMSEEESLPSVQPRESQQESQSSQRTIHVQATTNEELIQRN